MDFSRLRDRLENNESNVAVIGMGYVGMPLAVALSKSGLKVYGIDVDKVKLNSLKKGRDPNREIEDSQIQDALNQGIEFTDVPSKIRQCDFIIICVPTPVTPDNKPDMSYIRKSSETIGKNLRENSVVILESTVYPGTTEEVIRPILEAQSGLKWKEGFSLGYSPERINPGDKEHTLEKITKVVSGDSEESGHLICSLYKRVSKDTFLAKDIKTAEAAKVIENIQRDLNIALMNELSIIFNKMGIDTKDVLEAAGTKWNFHKYFPGLVSGHCIPCDPYYLVHKSKMIGYIPKIILAGRDINNYMPIHSVLLLEKELEKKNKSINRSKILLLGLTFKKNVSDLRNTQSKKIIEILKEKGAIPTAYDPLLNRTTSEKHFGIEILDNLDSAKDFDAVMLVTDHDNFSSLSPDQIKSFMKDQPIFIDIRRMFDREAMESAGISYSGF